jgi:ABC-2 type transport system ATP-binding protein
MTAISPSSTETQGSAQLPAIAVEHAVKRYGDFEAVKDVSFSVAEGEIFGLLGPNGAGKSTLIRMMTTLIPLTAGRAIVAGHDVAKDPDAVRRVIGVIPQALTSDPDLTVEENLSIYAKLYSMKSPAAWFTIPASSFSTNPRPASIRSRASPFGRC